MIDALLIRAAQPDDVEQLLTIRHAAILALAAEKYGPDGAQAWAHAATAARFQQTLAQNHCFVALFDGQPVGWVEFAANQVNGLYVRPAQTQQGIGSALLAYAEREILAAGYRAVTLDASWNAEEFYLRRGYRSLAARSLKTGRPMVKTFGTPTKAVAMISD